MKLQDQTDRIKMVQSMEFICRQINDEELFFNSWGLCGVADGDIEYGDFSQKDYDFIYDTYCADDEEFKELMQCFLRTMKRAEKDGLYCGGVCT